MLPDYHNKNHSAIVCAYLHALARAYSESTSIKTKKTSLYLNDHSSKVKSY